MLSTRRVNKEEKNGIWAQKVDSFKNSTKVPRNKQETAPLKSKIFFWLDTTKEVGQQHKSEEETKKINRGFLNSFYKILISRPTMHLAFYDKIFFRGSMNFKFLGLVKQW